MKIDKNGDSEGNFSVLALVPTSDNVVYKDYKCNHQMRPVGQFFQLDSAYPVSEFIVFLFLCRFTSAKMINSRISTNLVLRDHNSSTMGSRIETWRWAQLWFQQWIMSEKRHPSKQYNSCRNFSNHAVLCWCYNHEHLSQMEDRARDRRIALENWSEWYSQFLREGYDAQL